MRIPVHNRQSVVVLSPPVYSIEPLVSLFPISQLAPHSNSGQAVEVTRAQVLYDVEFRDTVLMSPQFDKLHGQVQDDRRHHRRNIFKIRLVRILLKIHRGWKYAAAGFRTYFNFHNESRQNIQYRYVAIFYMTQGCWANSYDE